MTSGVAVRCFLYRPVATSQLRAARKISVRRWSLNADALAPPAQRELVFSNRHLITRRRRPISHQESPSASTAYPLPVSASALNKFRDDPDPYRKIPCSIMQGMPLRIPRKTKCSERTGCSVNAKSMQLAVNFPVNREFVARYPRRYPSPAERAAGESVSY